MNKNHLATDVIEKLKRESLTPLLEQRFTTSNVEFSIKAAPIINSVKGILQILWKIDNQRISLKRQIQEEVKKKYIQVVSNKELSEHINYDYQGMIFSTLSIAMMEYFILSDKEIDPIMTQANLQNVLSYFISE